MGLAEVAGLDNKRLLAANGDAVALFLGRKPLFNTIGTESQLLEPKGRAEVPLEGISALERRVIWTNSIYLELLHRAANRMAFDPRKFILCPVLRMH